jgi:hypothetical protein
VAKVHSAPISEIPGANPHESPLCSSSQAQSQSTYIMSGELTRKRPTTTLTLVAVLEGWWTCKQPRCGRESAEFEGKMTPGDADLSWPRFALASVFPWSVPLSRSAELCGPGGSAVDLLDRAEDHRRGALD